MFYAPYKPADRVLVEYQVDRVTVTRALYLIIDVCPDKRGGFHYEAAELTKKGAMHARRAPHWLCPRPTLTMRLSDAPVCEDSEREASYYRECAQTSRSRTLRRKDRTSI